MVMIFTRSTACNVAKESQALFRYHVGKRGTSRHCPDFFVCYMTSVRDPEYLVESHVSDAFIPAHKYLVVAQVSHPYIRTGAIYVL